MSETELQTDEAEPRETGGMIEWSIIHRRIILNMTWYCTANPYKKTSRRNDNGQSSRTDAGTRKPGGTAQRQFILRNYHIENRADVV
ncbi:MAG: hypothetical protein K5744_01620 [Eubacterium sp.]|nr:hypothetical protein [Eubacterium sp.]